MPLSFETVYSAHFDYVWHTLRRLRVPERHLEDLVHDVFVVVYHKLAEYDESRPVKPWLFGITYRTAFSFLRKSSTRREIMDEPVVASDAPSADRLIERAQAQQVVDTALEHLDPEQRAVFVMHDIDGIAIPDVASTLEIRLNTAYSRLRLARAKFAKSVRRYQLNEESHERS